MRNPVSAALAGLLDLHRSAPSLAALSPDERLDGRVALVTGANRGLGKAISVQLAQRGARVVMASRSGIPEAGAEVMRASSSTEVEMHPLDLADLRTVLALCAELKRRLVRLDLVVLNAGVVPREARRTAQGFELMFGVNFLANVLLVERLLELGLLRLDAPGAHPRLVFVSSETHRDAGPVDFAQLGTFTPHGAMESMRVYGYSKFLLNVYAAELARRLGARAGVHSLCPGAVDTDIAREAPTWVKPVLGAFMERFFRAPEAAAEPVTFLCCSHTLEGTTGKYLHGMEEKRPAPETVDTWVGARLVRDSRALIARTLGEKS
jgi:NAD(P)-dependent dehydrogenase (short-subunit alcohol dehydrogenase family)